MSKSETKYFNTALLMDEALIELLDKKPYEYITVKEVCKKAGVNRSTFYLHYESMDDLLAEAIKNTDDSFMASFNIDSSAFVSSLQSRPKDELILITPEYLVPYLSFAKEHRALYKANFSHSKTMDTEARMKNLYTFIMRPIMERFDASESKEFAYWSTYYVHGITAVVMSWINGGCLESPEEVADIIIHCVRPYSHKK